MVDSPYKGPAIIIIGPYYNENQCYHVYYAFYAFDIKDLQWKCHVSNANMISLYQTSKYPLP